MCPLLSSSSYPQPSSTPQLVSSKIIFEQKVENDTVEPSSVGGEIDAMAALGLDIRLEIRGAAEISAEGFVEDARAVTATDDEVILPRDDEGGTLEIRCLEAHKTGRDGDQLADGERFYVGLGIGNHAAVVGARFEELLNEAEDVRRSDVSAVKDGEGAGLLQTCDPRREPFEHDLGIKSVEPVAGKNDSVGDGRVARYQRV